MSKGVLLQCHTARRIGVISSDYNRLCSYVDALCTEGYTAVTVNCVLSFMKS